MVHKLVPEKRADKNGRLVTRLVRPADAPTGSDTTIPAPSMRGAVRAAAEPSPKKLVGEIEDAFNAHGLSMPNVVRTFMVKWCEDGSRSYVEKLHSISQGFEYRDALYFRQCMGGTDQRGQNKLRIAIDSFEFCAAVEDAAPGARGVESRCMNRMVDNFSSSSFNEFHAGDVSAAYLLERVGFDGDRCFGNKADYYRMSEKVRQNLDLIQPMLPIIILLSSKLHWNKEEDLFSVMDALKKYPRSAMPLILDMVKDRGTFDDATVERALRLGNTPMVSGIL